MFKAAGTLLRGSWKQKLNRLSAPTSQRGTCQGGWLLWGAYRTRGAARRWACVELGQVESPQVEGQDKQGHEWRSHLALLAFALCLTKRNFGRAGFDQRHLASSKHCSTLKPYPSLPCREETNPKTSHDSIPSLSTGNHYLHIPHSP